MRSAWHRYWFVDDAPVNLAVARVLAAGIALWVLCSRDFAAVSALPPVFWEGVPQTVRWRFLAFPDQLWIESVVLWVARACALAAMVGLWPRLTCLLTALLLYHIAPLDGIIWTDAPYGRGLTLPLLTLAICAAAPSGDALTLFGSEGRVGDREATRYGWPMRLIQLFVAQVYIFAGTSKLQLSGLGWFHHENLRNWLLLAGQNVDTAVHTAVGGFLAASPLTAGAVGVGTLVLELGFVLALVRWKWRVWIAIAGIAFHAAIYLAMNITFQSWPLLLVFVDWRGVLERVPRGAPA